MFTLQDYFKLISYRINGGYEFQWKCYGPNAHGIDHDGSINGKEYFYTVR